MSNVRWSIVIPEETDRALRSFLAQRGTKKGDISRFVEEAVQSHLLELTVEGIKERNRLLSSLDACRAGYRNFDCRAHHHGYSSGINL